MAWNEDWPSMAACQSEDPDTLFVQGAAQNRAKVVCGGCGVRAECLADALDNRIEFGVWGGMTERERRALLRRRPGVTSWREVLQSAKTSFEAAATGLPQDADMPAREQLATVHHIPLQRIRPAASAQLGPQRDREGVRT